MALQVTLGTTTRDMLRSIAEMAYGSKEHEAGGRGYIGMLKGHVVKFNTHHGERWCMSVTDDMKKSSNDLRLQLSEITNRIFDHSNGSLSNEVVAKIRKDLGLSDDGKTVASKKLLERKVVAKVIDTLAKAAKVDDVWRSASSVADFLSSQSLRNTALSVSNQEILNEYGEMENELKSGLKKESAPLSHNQADSFINIYRVRANKDMVSREFIDGLINEIKNDYPNLQEFYHRIDEEVSLGLVDYLTHDKDASNLVNNFFEKHEIPDLSAQCRKFIMAHLTMRAMKEDAVQQYQTQTFSKVRDVVGCMADKLNFKNVEFRYFEDKLEIKLNSKYADYLKNAKKDFDFTSVKSEFLAKNLTAFDECISEIKKNFGEDTDVSKKLILSLIGDDFLKYKSHLVSCAIEASNGMREVIENENFENLNDLEDKKKFFIKLCMNSYKHTINYCIEHNEGTCMDAQLGTPMYSLALRMLCTKDPKKMTALYEKTKNDMSKIQDSLISEDDRVSVPKDFSSVRNGDKVDLGKLEKDLREKHTLLKLITPSSTIKETTAKDLVTRLNEEISQLSVAISMAASALLTPYSWEDLMNSSY